MKIRIFRLRAGVCCCMFSIVRPCGWHFLKGVSFLSHLSVPFWIEQRYYNMMPNQLICTSLMIRRNLSCTHFMCFFVWTDFHLLIFFCVSTLPCSSYHFIVRWINNFLKPAKNVNTECKWKSILVIKPDVVVAIPLRV